MKHIQGLFLNPEAPLTGAYSRKRLQLPEALARGLQSWRRGTKKSDSQSGASPPLRPRRRRQHTASERGWAWLPSAGTASGFRCSPSPGRGGAPEGRPFGKPTWGMLTGGFLGLARFVRRKKADGLRAFWGGSPRGCGGLGRAQRPPPLEVGAIRSRQEALPVGLPGRL